MKVLVGRLGLESYKATIRGLAQFGDRQQGTDRNRAAVDWIEAQLRSYGCTHIERFKYVYAAPTPGAREQVYCTKIGATRAELKPGCGLYS